MQVDHHIGELLETLEQQGVREYPFRLFERQRVLPRSQLCATGSA